MRAFIRYASAVGAALATLAVLALALALPASAPAAAPRSTPGPALTPTVAASVFLPLLQRSLRDPDPVGQWTRYALPGNPQVVNKIVMSSDVSGWAVGQASDIGAIWHFDGWAWQLVSIPTVGELRGLSVVNDSDVWAAGQGAASPGALLHWDGSTWSLTSWPGEQERDVLAFSASDVWAVGFQLAAPGLPTTPSIHHWNGAEWVDAPNPTPDWDFGRFAAISPTDILLIESNDQVLLHWNGVSWGVAFSPSLPRGVVGVELRGFSASSNDNAWTAPGWTLCNPNTRIPPICHVEGTFYRWDGHAWNGTTAAVDARDVQALSPSLARGITNDLGADPRWNYPDSSSVYRWNGAAWEQALHLPGALLQHLFVLAPADIWAADNNAVYHYPMP